MTAETRSGFGELLRRSRIDAGLTQEELAERAGVSARAVSDLERGVYARPRHDTLRRLARALQLSPEDHGRFEQLAQGQVGPSGSMKECGALPTGNFLGALPIGPLVGREAELEQLLQVMAAIEQNQGRLVLLTGEPGIGKTRLAQELTICLRDRGILLAAGRCAEADETVPYHPFVEALTALYHLAPPTLRATVAQDWPQLAALLPEERVRAHRQGGGYLEDQQLLFYTVTRFLDAMTRLAPLALMLDDLHWVDGSSLNLLMHLAHHTRTLPILLLGTYRDEEVGRQHPLEGVLRDLQRAELVERIPVRRLNQQESGTLVEETLGDAGVGESLTRLLYQRTEGNPFFLQQVVRSLAEQGEIDRQDGHWTRKGSRELEVPESVRSVIGHRLSRLSTETQEVLCQASVLGQTFHFDELHALSGRSEDALDASLIEAERAGLVTERDREVYAFDHALTHQTLYDELSARRKRKLHRAAGEALETLPERQRQGRVAELARHYLHGDDPAKALAYSLLAGDAAAAAVGYAEAERHYRTAEELARELEDTRRIAETQEKRGGVLGPVGRTDEAITVLEHAADCYHALGDREGEARAVAEMGLQQFFRGTTNATIDRTWEMLEILEGMGAPEILAKLYLVKTAYYFSKLRFNEAVQSNQQGLEAARRTNDPRLLGTALVTAGIAARIMGHPDEAIRLLQEAVLLTDATGDVYWAMGAAKVLGEAYWYTGELELAAPQFEREFALAQRLEHHEEMAYAWANVATTLFFRGRWEEAEREYRRALDLVSQAGASWGAWNTLMHFGSFCVAVGQWEEAEHLLAAALASSERRDDLQWRYTVLDALAELDLLRGNPERALGWLEAIRQHPAADPGTELDWSVLGWTLLEVGKIADAAAVAQRGLHPTNGSLQQLFLPAWLELSGAVAATQGHWERATRQLREGLSAARSMGMPYYEGRILYRLGLTHVQREELEEARTQLEAALTIFQRLGAKPYLERTAQALAAIALDQTS